MEICVDFSPNYGNVNNIRGEIMGSNSVCAFYTLLQFVSFFHYPFLHVRLINPYRMVQLIKNLDKN
jgi:hypothetical protein